MGYIAIQEIAGKPMTAEQLMRAVKTGDTVHAAEVISCLIHASVKLDGDVIVMWGASGNHKLLLTATNAERLLAHWTGFKEVALAAARKITQDGYIRPAQVQA